MPWLFDADRIEDNRFNLFGLASNNLINTIDVKDAVGVVTKRGDGSTRGYKTNT